MTSNLVVKRSPVLMLGQIPLAIRGMLQRNREREARRQRNRAYFRQFFGLEKKTHAGRLGDAELCESNLPLQ